MSTIYFHRYGHTDALDAAESQLAKLGYTFLPHPTNQVTHLLLPVPALNPDGSIKGGGLLEQILCQLPKGITIVGGNLNHPLLENYTCIDLLKDPQYLAANAAITAHCALKIAMSHSKLILTDHCALVIGWGRIGKCLSRLLKDLGCNVAVATRKAEDRAILSAMGYIAEDSANITNNKYTLIFNTSPEPVYTISSKDILAIELASTSGLFGDNILLARGLPSNEAPESSGKLIAKTIHEIIEKGM